jgi:hypothetical protein
MKQGTPTQKEAITARACRARGTPRWASLDVALRLARSMWRGLSNQREDSLCCGNSPQLFHGMQFGDRYQQTLRRKAVPDQINEK